MSKNKSLMYQYDQELATAFQIDCEDLLIEFEKRQSFSFVDFQQVWKLKSFTFVYAGQVYALLLKDFCDNCFMVVKKYIMFPKNLYTQLGALYLLYGLYYKQPLREWIKIRITYEEYCKLYELIIEMRNRNEMEPLYIFAKLRTDEAFLYVAQRKPLGPEDRFVKDIKTFIDDTFRASKTQSALNKFEELSKTEFFTKFCQTNEIYTKLFEVVSNKYSSIRPFPSNLVEEINNAYKIFNGDPNLLLSSTKNEEKPTSIQTSRKSIKAKALANKHAVYRANKKVITAVDDSESSLDDLDFDLKLKPSTSKM